MKYIKKAYLKEIEVSDLDLDNVDKILGHNRDGHDYDVIITAKNGIYWHNEAIEISIDLLIEKLEELKKADANYVEIMYHCDHHGYNLNGLKMTKATKEEINAYKKAEKMAEDASKQKEINELEKKLSKLKR